MAGGFCPDVFPTRDEIERNKTLSDRLYRMMENKGITTEVRDIMKEGASLLEITATFIILPRYSYITGSEYEGTRDRDIESDVDVVYIDTDKPVATNISNCPHPICFLLLPTEQPGYFKLQLTVSGKPISKDYQYLPPDNKYLLKPDKVQRRCLIQKQNDIPGTYWQGPARRWHCNKSAAPVDALYALKGEDWPDYASEWITRHRDTGWPSEDLITKCKTLGFFVVYKCHPASSEKEFQWRISISLQERLLVTEFNSVQLKCYILLKLIKKEIINPAIKGEKLTSYHCKTCMLYMIENTPSEIWISENLVSCVLMCLRQLLTYVINNNCPNYFIPGENMFDRITSDKQREHLGHVLETILNTPAYYFDVLKQLIIKKDKFFTKQYEYKYSARNVLFNTNAYKLIAKIEALKGFISFKSCVLENNVCTSLADFQKYFIYTLDEIEKTKTITDHPEEETKLAKKLICPFFRVHLLSCNLVCALSTESETVQKILSSKQWEQQAPIASYSKLKQAAAMLMLKHHAEAFDVLMSILDSKKFSCCRCIHVMFYTPSLQELQKAIRNRPGITIIELLNDFLQFCVMILPIEQEITPTALQYEMVRDFGVQPSSIDFDNYKQKLLWCKSGVVDGTFLLHFLLHLNYKALEKHVREKCHKTTHHVKKMIYLLNRKSVSHRETCLNLLGWAHKQRGDRDRAVKCFTKSLETASRQNAACWHLCFLICEY